MIVFRIEDPPPSKRPGVGRPSYVVQPIMILLLQHRGQWARVAEFDKPSSAGPLVGQLSIHPSVEAVSRTMEGKGVVFARWTS